MFLSSSTSSHIFIFHFLRPFNLFHSSPRPHLGAFQMFAGCFPKLPCFGLVQSYLLSILLIFSSSFQISSKNSFLFAKCCLCIDDPASDFFCRFSVIFHLAFRTLALLDTFQQLLIYHDMQCTKMSQQNYLNYLATCFLL